MNYSNFRKNVEISSTLMRVTKKSIKVIDKVSRELIGSFDSEKYANQVSKDKTQEEIDSLREEYKKQYQIKRQTKISDIAECNDFFTMITLTFDSEDNQTEEQVKYNWKKAKQRLQYRYGKFKYICSLERGKNKENGENTGHLHFHIITDIVSINNHSQYWNDKKTGTKKLNKDWAEDEILDLIDSTSNRSKSLKNKRIELYNEGASYLKVLLGFGHVHIKSINENDVKYITKYATKDKDLNTKYKRTVWTSKCLEYPVRVYNYEVIDMLFDMIPQEEYEYKESIVLAQMGESVHECMRVQTLTFQDISEFYYLTQQSACGYNLYLAEVERDRKKIFNIMYPVNEKVKDINYFNELYGVKKRQMYSNSIKRILKM